MGTSSSTSTAVSSNDSRSVADGTGTQAGAGGNAKDNGVVQRLSVHGYGDGAVNAKISITNTDYGAIDSALTFASSAANDAKATVKDVLGIAEGNFSKTTAALTDAYKDAKGGALVLQNVTIGMMVTIAALGYFFFVKGKKS